MSTVRPEIAEDLAGIRSVNEQAFGRPVEADLIDALRRDGAAAISLVATVDGEVVGHVLFSPVRLEPELERFRGLSLSTLAVLPEHQRRGIGSRLVEGGLAACHARGEGFCVVIGHPDYYPRFGFVPAARYGVHCQYDNVPEDVFMIKEIMPGALGGISGVIRYHPEFDQFSE